MDNYVKVVKLGSDFLAKVAKDCIAKKFQLMLYNKTILKLL